MLIERSWPKGQDQLAILLRGVRNFYTWDSWTATNVEAVLCGAIPVFMRYEPWTEIELDGSELGIIPRMDELSIFDINKYEQDRMSLISKIKELNDNWCDRVKVFIEMVTSYFDK